MILKDYQKERLTDLLRLIDQPKATGLLVITLPEDANLRQQTDQKEFLGELEAFYSTRDITIEEFSIASLQSMWDDRYYDIILLRYVLWKQRNSAMNPGRVLRLLARHLTPGGRIIILENNGMGIRSLTGDRYDGLEKASGMRRREVLDAVSFAGLYASFYYPHPYAEDMEYLFSDERLPQGERLCISVREGEPRIEFYPEEELAAGVVSEGLFPSMAAQFFCIATKDKIRQALLYKHYVTHRDKRFVLTKSLYSTNSGRASFVYEPSSDVAGAFIKSIFDNYQKLVDTYKGYTLQITPCSYDDGKVIALVPDGVSFEELLDKTLRDEDKDGFLQLIRRLSDILTAPTRLDEAARGGVRFSDEPRFIRAFGEFFGSEEELFADEPALPVSPLEGAFSDFKVSEKNWTLMPCVWTVDFPVPFSYILYRLLRKYFSEGAWRDPGQVMEQAAWQYLSISDGMIRVFERMYEHFISFSTGRAMTMERIRTRAIAEGEFLPVGEVAAAFLDGKGVLPTSVAEEYENVDTGFLDKVKQLMARMFRDWE